MLPNAIVLAFDDRVRFEASTHALEDGLVDYSHAGRTGHPRRRVLRRRSRSRHGSSTASNATAAIRDADLAEFPVAAVGFIATGEEEQRSQFILVNNTKPLPKGLIHELLPETTGTPAAARYARRRLPRR